MTSDQIEDDIEEAIFHLETLREELADEFRELKRAHRAHAKRPSCEDRADAVEVALFAVGDLADRIREEVAEAAELYEAVTTTGIVGRTGNRLAAKLMSRRVDLLKRVEDAEAFTTIAENALEESRG